MMNWSMMKRFLGIAVLVMATIGSMLPLAAQEPASVPGEIVVVPVVGGSEIVIDGDLGDWATLPATLTSDGPQPSADPANSGQMRWQLAADQNALYFSATITDDNIVAGEHGDDYWNEDSIELYLNFSGDASATTYGPDIGQITFSPVDRGQTDPTQLTISGNGAPLFDVNGLVFATTAGWGVEAAITLEGTPVEVIDGAGFGVQVQANGSSGGDRDLKISWSVADVADTSFQDPSVFGRALLFDDSVTPPGVTDETSVEDSVLDSVATELQAEAITGELDLPVTEEDDEPNPSRALFFAAILSAVSILVGGLWFERRRKKSEELAAASITDEESVDSLIASILESEDDG